MNSFKEFIQTRYDAAMLLMIEGLVDSAFKDFILAEAKLNAKNLAFYPSGGGRHKTDDVSIPLDDEDLEAASEEMAKSYQAYSIIRIVIDDLARKKAAELGMPLWSKKDMPPPEILVNIGDKFIGPSPSDPTKTKKINFAVAVARKLLSMPGRFTKVLAANDLLSGKGPEAESPAGGEARLTTRVKQIVAGMIEGKNPEYDPEIANELWNQIKKDHPDIPRKTFSDRIVQKTNERSWIPAIRKWLDDPIRNKGDNDPITSDEIEHDSFPSPMFTPPENSYNKPKEKDAEWDARDAAITELLKDPRQLDILVTQTAINALNSVVKRDGQEYLRDIIRDPEVRQDWIQQASMAILAYKGHPDFMDPRKRTAFATLRLLRMAADQSKKRLGSGGDSSEILANTASRSSNREDEIGSNKLIQGILDNPTILTVPNIRNSVVNAALADDSVRIALSRLQRELPDNKDIALILADIAAKGRK